MFSVILMEKGGPERRLSFDKEELTIGRISGNDIILPKGNISKRHARLVVKDDKFIVIDLKSTNGTYVNKERISAPRVVGDDDKIYVGDFVIQLLGVGAVPPRHDESTARADAPAPREAIALPPPPPPPPHRGRTDQAPPSAMLLGDDEAEAATRAVSIDQIEAAAMRIESGEAIDVVEVEFDVEPGDPSVELIVEADEEVLEAEIDVPEEVELELAEVPPEAAAFDPRVVAPLAAASVPTAIPLGKSEAPRVLAPPAEPPRAEPPKSDSVRRMAPVASPQAPVIPPPAAVEKAPEPARAPPPPPAPAPDSDDEEADGRFEAYVAVLEQLHSRAASSVFAGVSLDGDLSDAEWTSLEKAVGSLVTTARAAGAIPEFLDDATLTHDVLYEFTGLGPVEYFLSDDQVSRIFIGDFNQILVTSEGTTSAVWKSFSSPAALERVVDKLASSLGFGPESRPPVLTGELPDGTVFQVVLPPLAATGPVLSFDRPSRRRVSMKALLDQGALTEEESELLVQAVARRANIAVVGRRAEDRQAIVGSLALFVPEDERVLVVEARQTVALPHRNVTRLRLPTLPDESAQLFRILPLLLGERLIVGPLSGGDAAALVGLAHSGAEGLLASFYARSADDAASRLACQIVAAGRASSTEAADALVCGAIDAWLFVDRIDGRFTLELRGF